MNWFFSIVRTAGASFPVAASFVQLQAEVTAGELDLKISRLEDPVSHLHDDVPVLSKKLFQEIKKKNSATVYLDPEDYQSFGRPLAVLEAHGCMQGHHAIGNRYAGGLTVIDPTFLMYMCRLSEDSLKMGPLINQVDSCTPRTWLDGKEISESLDLPLPVVRAVFEIYEAKGYGFLSKVAGHCRYMGKV